jgi:sugar phosphate isomerase/epimerase
MVMANDRLALPIDEETLQTMAGFQIGVATSDFRRGLKAAIPLAASVRAAGVAFDLRNELPASEFGATAIRQLLHSLSEHGLQVAGAYFPLRLPLYEAAHADERIAAIHAAMQRAHQLRAVTLAIETGPLPEPEGKDDQRLRETVNAIAAAGNQTGTIPCLDFGCQSATRVLQLLDQVDAGPIMIDVNPVDWLSDGSSDSAASRLRLGDLSFAEADSGGDDAAPQSLDGYLRALPQRIGHVQARDGRWVGRGTRDETAVGTGQVDWPFLLALLDEAAYAGWLTIRRESADAIDDITQGVAFLRSLSAR